jgi:hypothetical protein
MKQILDLAGIRMIEASQLFQITRATLYAWAKGSDRPKQGFVFRTAGVTCEKIQKAVDKGKLPLPEDVRGKRRLRYIREILKRH